MIIYFRVQDVEELWGAIDLATLLQMELGGRPDVLSPKLYSVQNYT